ncbi:fimbrial protein [Luteibacter sp. E-22]|uniref:fimbrial protein n=1 Tax=Luteibacter sp. E-22 TaxID=3404050 RepID=UPI003CF6EF9B
MRHIALFAGATLAFLAPLAATAADTAELKVSGTITPASCSVSILGPSEVQLDPVKLSDFTPGQDLSLDPKDASLSIDCQGTAARFRLKAVDSGEGVSTDGANHYSLGRNEQGGVNKPNGYFKLSIDADAMTSKYVLKSTDGGAGKAWGTPGTGVVAFDNDGEAFAFANEADATEPAALTDLTVPLKIAAVLAKDPVVNEDVALSGRATIEIFY